MTNQSIDDVLHLLTSLQQQQQQSQIYQQSQQQSQQRLPLPEVIVRARKPPPVARPSRDLDHVRTYHDAVNYIIELTSNSSHILGEVKQIQKNQRDHEQTWFNSRQVIVDTYEKRREVARIISAAGGTQIKDIDNQRDRELQKYDLKVHRALCEMMNAQEKEFKTLGIPCFADKAIQKKIGNLLQQLIDDK